MLRRACRAFYQASGALPWPQGYEIPRDFVVDTEPFRKANHLLTDSGKPARGKLKAK